MKIKLMVSDNSYEKLAAALTEKGIEIDEDADLILTERNQYINHLTGRGDGEIYRIGVADIICIESLSHDIFVYTSDGCYKVRERLRQLETLLDPEQFLRVSNAVIIARHQVKRIKPAMSSKYLLTMTDGRHVDVTRSYYNIFRDSFGI